MNKKRAKRGITVSIIAGATLLIICLAVTGAILLSSVLDPNSKTKRGKIELDLNNNVTVFSDSNHLIAPGMSIEKEFYLKNNSNFEVYYRLYADDITGNLADILVVNVFNKNGVSLFSGSMLDFEKQNIASAMGTLVKSGEIKLAIKISYPEGEGNEGQNGTIEFSIKAEAVRVRNNPDGLFE